MAGSFQVDDRNQSIGYLESIYGKYTGRLEIIFATTRAIKCRGIVVNTSREVIVRLLHPVER